MKRVTLLLNLFFLALCCVQFPANALENYERLMRDLMIVDYWNKRINDKPPVTYDHLLQGGYLNMPSARMGNEGEIGAGYSYVHPYINYSLRVQLLRQLEISGNYRIFKGIADPILSPLGFGDLSDKGANVKFALFLPEDSDYELPGVAVGYEDFIGTQSFRARYVVATQVFRDWDMEISLGYGQHRFKGFFGGMSWMPFRKCGWDYLSPISLVAEYDATPYKSKVIEKHPKGRKQKTPFNFGLKYRLLDRIDLSLSYIRGVKWAFAISTFYDFGHMRGFLPKIDDPLPYQAPINTEPVGEIRPYDVLIQDLYHPLEEQGFDLLKLWLVSGSCHEKILHLRVVNNNLRQETEVRDRLNHLVTALIPRNIDEVIITIEGEGLPIQEYRYRMEFVRRFAAGEISIYELNLITPLNEVSYPDPCKSSLLFESRRDFWNIELFPKSQALFGSSKGKFKYALGLNLGVNGFLFSDIYYSTVFGMTFLSNLRGLSGIDRLNPSQIINVRSDIVEYYKQKGITLDQAYLQKNWNVGRGWFGRLSAGLFEMEYGGAAGEILYYPLDSHWAVGVEAAYLRKRNYKGFGFSDRIRKLRGFEVLYKKFIGKQYFVNLYYTLEECSFDVRIKAGKFLANDWGARFELSRYFASGLQLIVWYTWTNGHDRINGKTYHDKGVGFSMPLDIFYTHSERDRFGQKLSAWLRDVGVVAENGMGLFEMISEQRE